MKRREKHNYFIAWLWCIASGIQFLFLLMWKLKFPPNSVMNSLAWGAQLSCCILHQEIPAARTLLQKQLCRWQQSSCTSPGTARGQEGSPLPPGRGALKQLSWQKNKDSGKDLAPLTSSPPKTPLACQKKWQRVAISACLFPKKNTFPSASS